MATTYDAEKYGALCDQCTLSTRRAGGPVGGEIRPGAKAIIITEFPRERDIETGRPLTDNMGGMEFNESLKAIGVRRDTVNITHAIACRPVENDIDKEMLLWQRENKKRVAAGEEPLPSPIQCCRPRLMNDIGGVHNLVTLGKRAFQAVTGSNAAILEIRGGPIEGKFNAAEHFEFKPADLAETGPSNDYPIKLLPTLHPGFVVHVRRWTKPFRSDVARAFRWFENSLGWKNPEIILNPTYSQLTEFLESSDTFVVDTETTFEDPLISRLKCIGFATENKALCVHFYSIEDESKFYNQFEENKIRQYIKDFLVNENILKIGHNFNYFDSLVLQHHFGVTPKPVVDTLVMHRLVESELPHGLGFIGSLYTDVASWKAAHTAKEAKSDFELGTYCCMDTIVNYRIINTLANSMRLKKQDHLLDKDLRIQDICRGMHEVGMWVDMKRRRELAVEIKHDIINYLAEVQKSAGIPDFNPNSAGQIRKLLFETWRLAPVEYTKLGDPKTDDFTLRMLRAEHGHNLQINTFIFALRKYKKAVKMYGTYIQRMVPYGHDVGSIEIDDDDRSDDQETMPEDPRGLILADGRMHPDYNATGTRTGRLSSSNPNAQNFVKRLRSMVRAAPGHVLVGADADHLELRIITAVAQIKAYLEVFQDPKGDPHAMTASLMFGEAFTKLVRKSDQWTNLRKLGKGIAYASFYGSGDETVHSVVTSAEEDGKPVYPNLTVREVALMRRKWLGNIPEMKKWWDRTVDEYRDNGHLVDPVWGRRRDFLDGEKFNELINFGIQCVPGWSRVLTKDGYLPIESLLGREVIAWTGKRWAPARVIPKGVKELYRVHTERGMHFTCDDAHKAKFVGREGYEWRTLFDAAQGGRFALDLARPLEFGHPMAEHDAYAAGYWIGDGHSNREGHDSYSIGFTIAESKEDPNDTRAGQFMLDKIQAWAQARGVELSVKNDEGCFTGMVYKGGYEWLKSIGADPAWKAHTKRVPDRIWTASLQDRKDFIRGYLDADGYKNPSDAILINCCQRDLLQDVMILARTVGIESSIDGPFKADTKGHEAFRLRLNSAQTYNQLGWGAPCKLRTSPLSNTPRFEFQRVLPALEPTCHSDNVIRSRLRHTPNPEVSAYVLNRMGIDDIYDHDKFVSASSRRICVPVYTLSVDDEDHQYVAEGIISKNSAGAHIVHDATFKLIDQIPFFKWGPGTGLINQCHDALVFEVPMDHEKYKGDDAEFKWCPPNCKCTANKIARMIKEAMNVELKELPGVKFSATPEIDMTWDKV